MAKVGIGIIGTGTIAQSHLNSLRTSENGQAVAVFDVLGDRAEATAKQCGAPGANRRPDVRRRRSSRQVNVHPPFRAYYTVGVAVGVTV